MGRPSRFSSEVRERAVRLVMEQRPAHPSEWAALQAVAPKLGTTAETLVFAGAIWLVYRALFKNLPKEEGKEQLESDFWEEWFSACETTERQKYGIDSLTFPASSMNSV